MMTSKERMMLAINRQKPDRLPVTIHQWQPYHLKKYMNNMTDIEANRACGLDASITYFEAVEEPSSQWKITTKVEQLPDYYITHYQIETPKGILTMKKGTNPMTTWVMEHLIKEPEDIYLYQQFSPIPKFNKAGAQKVYDQLGDDGILRTFLYGYQGGCWQDACELFGVEPLIMATFDDPDWVHEFMKILLDKKLTYIDENIANTAVEVVETGGGASSNTVISPAIHEEFCLPYDSKMHEAIRGIGKKSVYHTCGGMTKIGHLLIQNKADISETFSPTGVGGDIETDEQATALYQTIHPVQAIIGGMDQFNILEKGTKEQIEKEVARLFRLYGQDGGYIMSASDHFFEAPPENIKHFAQAAKAYQY